MTRILIFLFLLCLFDNRISIELNKQSYKINEKVQISIINKTNHRLNYYISLFGKTGTEWIEIDSDIFSSKPVKSIELKKMKSDLKEVLEYRLFSSSYEIDLKGIKQNNKRNISEYKFALIFYVGNDETEKTVFSSAFKLVK